MCFQGDFLFDCYDTYVVETRAGASGAASVHAGPGYDSAEVDEALLRGDKFHAVEARDGADGL